MSDFNKKKVIEFIKAHVNSLVKLEKFKGLSTDLSNDTNIDLFINKMKLTPEGINILLKVFELVKVPAGQMFVHTESICERGEPNASQLAMGKFFELTPDVYKGTMCLTSCWDEEGKNWTVKNQGYKFNISTNSVFFGKYQECFGRMLIYRNTTDLHMLFTGIHNLGGRKAFTYLITKLLLGNDYNFDFPNGFGLNRIPEDCKKNCPENCTTGLWSYEKALIEQCWGYFMEAAFYENTVTPPIGGMIINDSSYDAQDEIQLSGTEFRVFCVDKVLTLESVMYRNKFYLNKEHYKQRLEKDFKNYNPDHPTVVPRESKYIPSIETFTKLLNTYCDLRMKSDFQFNTNIFDRVADSTKKFDKTFSIKHIPMPVPIQTGGDKYKNKYLKYKKKYMLLKKF